MSSLPTSEATVDSTFICDCAGVCRLACVGEPFYNDHEGKHYCVLHFPGKRKNAKFEKALQRKLDNKDFKFCGVWFPDELSLSGFDFSTDADFSYAFFNKKVDFYEATFSADANFYEATFGAKVDFGKATFSKGATFYLATFRAEADFYSATFGESVESAGGENRSGFSEAMLLDLQYAIFKKPSQVFFYSLTLCPHWFVNVDARKFDFNKVDWVWRSTDEEIESLESKDVSSSHEILAIACRRLADNAEKNRLYEEASKFRYMAMEAQRRERWRRFAFLHNLRRWMSERWQRLSQYRPIAFFRRGWLHWLYWVASGYGERVFRAFLVLIGIWLLFAIIYTQVGFARWEPKRTNEKEAMTEQRDEAGERLRLSRAMTYSLGVMTLQKPEPRPATTTAQSFVILETILGPLQAALLALAIRRKFMR